MTFKERISTFAAHYGLSVKQFQDKLGLSNAHFSNASKVTPRVALKIRELYPEANIEWLNLEKGTMLLGEENAVPLNNMLVPLIPTYASAGSLSNFADAIAERDCEKILSPVKNVTCAITIRGDSMAPEYSNGSIIFIRKINDEANFHWGATYVLDTNNGVVIKNLFPSKDEDCILCRSINTNYPDFEVMKSDIIGVYKVVFELTMKE